MTPSSASQNASPEGPEVPALGHARVQYVQDRQSRQPPRRQTYVMGPCFSRRWKAYNKRDIAEEEDNNTFAYADWQPARPGYKVILSKYNDNLDKMMIHALYSMAPMHRCVATTGHHCTNQTLHGECPVCASTACLNWTQLYWAIQINEAKM